MSKLRSLPDRLSFARTACAAWIALVGLALAVDAQRTNAKLADLERISIADTMVMVPMRDGVRLATDIRPRPLPNQV